MVQFFKQVLGTVVGLVIFSVLSFIFLIMIIASASSSVVSVPKRSVLEINMRGVMNERSEEDLAVLIDNNAEQAIGLDDVLDVLKNAKDDNRIYAVLLKMDNFQADYAMLHEVRTALDELKNSGKYVFAYSDNYSQSEYYVASVADTVIMNPYGSLDIHGLALKSMFYKGLMDNLGVEMQIVKVGEYKSATEVFTEVKMSDANREQSAKLVEDLWSSMKKEIAASRNIDEVDVQAAADSFMAYRPAESATPKFVDLLLYEDDVYDFVEKESDVVDKISMEDYLSCLEKESEMSSDKVAVVYAVGEIGDDLEGVNYKKLAKEIDKIEKDYSVKAIVLRVNSPGGSAFGSELIWKALNDARKTKPVVVSMSGYAASGGYYISCMADKIVSSPYTLTGSIGIYGMIPNLEGVTNKVGLSTDVVKSSEFADSPDLFRPMTERERHIVQQNVNRGYDLFIKRCADGRKVKAEDISNLAQGRVWSGVSALSNGLVDTLGSLDDAVKIAAKFANLEEYSIAKYPAKKTLMDRLMEKSQVKMGPGLDIERDVLHKLKRMEKLQAKMPKVVVE